jgi:isopenicillin N synthase-like dioxygenase
VNPGENPNQSRYSMPRCLHPRPDVELKPAFSADQFLQKRLKEIGLK